MVIHFCHWWEYGLFMLCQTVLNKLITYAQQLMVYSSKVVTGISKRSPPEWIKSVSLVMDVTYSLMVMTHVLNDKISPVP